MSKRRRRAKKDFKLIRYYEKQAHRAAKLLNEATQPQPRSEPTTP